MSKWKKVYVKCPVNLRLWARIKFIFFPKRFNVVLSFHVKNNESAEFTGVQMFFIGEKFEGNYIDETMVSETTSPRYYKKG